MNLPPTEAGAGLRRLLGAPEILVAPGCYDALTALLIEEAGFGAAYLSGASIAYGRLGRPDIGLVGMDEVASTLAAIRERIAIPIIVDADTGFGNALNVIRTVKLFERAGASAIQIEDQAFPKKCGHTLGRRVVPIEEAALKIRVAVESRDDPNFQIIARTDARTAHGLDEALRRGEAFAEAGADILFIESPESEAEMEKICRSFDKPLVANMVEGGQTPVLSAAELAEIGYSLAIFPATGFLAMGAALKGAYGHILREGSSTGLETPLDDFKEFSKLMGFERVWEFERRWAE